MVHRFGAFLLFCLFLSVTSFSNRHYYGRFEQYSFELGAAVQIQEENNDETIEQRNLRFAGIGRLYSTNNDSSSDDYLKVVDRMTKATVIVVGLGGVGSWAAEALCRSGVGSLVLIDLDDICISNTNRQLHAMSGSVGKFKIDEMANRFHNINPDCNVTLIHDFVSPENVDEILSTVQNVSACLDAIDGTRGKASLIAACARHSIPIVTCGGSAGRTDPSAFVVDDLSRASGDPLLSACRRNLRKLYGFEAGVSLKNKEGKMNKPPRKWNIRAVFSTEPQKSLPQGSDASSLRRCDGALGTGCFVTGTSGFVAAGEIVSMIAQDKLVLPRSFEGNKPRISGT